MYLIWIVARFWRVCGHDVTGDQLCHLEIWTTNHSYWSWSLISSCGCTFAACLSSSFNNIVAESIKIVIVVPYWHWAAQHSFLCFFVMHKCPTFAIYACFDVEVKSSAFSNHYTYVSKSFIEEFCSRLYPVFTPCSYLV